MINLILIIYYYISLYKHYRQGFLRMNGISADASVFYPKYDQDFPPIERENTEVVELRKELSRVRQQLVARDACMRKMAKELGQVEATNIEIQARADWLEGRKDKFKKKAEEAEKKYSEITEEISVLREDYEKKIINIQQSHQNELADTDVKWQTALENSDENYESLHERYKSVLAEVKELRNQDQHPDYDILNQRHESTLAELGELRRKYQSYEDWCGRSLKLKWIFDEMLKVGAIKLPDHEWALDMVHDIEFPEDHAGGQQSIFYSLVPLSLRQRFLPSHLDSHMEFIEEEDENEIIHRLSEEASAFSNSVGNNIFVSLESDHETTIKHIVNIQRHIRGYLDRDRVKIIIETNTAWDSWFQSLNPSAIIIQKHIRGFIARHNLEEWKLEAECWELWQNQHATTIQKHIRGFLARSRWKQSRFKDECQEIWQNLHATIIQKYWRRFNTSPIRYHMVPIKRRQINSSNRHEYQRNITLVNTGCIEYEYNHTNFPLPGSGRIYKILPQKSVSIRTYATHQFRVTHTDRTGEIIFNKFIRVPVHYSSSIDRSLGGTAGWIFDVHTGICFTPYEWACLGVFSRIQRTIHIPNRPIHPGIINPELVELARDLQYMFTDSRVIENIREDRDVEIIPPGPMIQRLNSSLIQL